MAIPETNFDPPFNLTRASHVRLATPDLEASRIDEPSPFPGVPLVEPAVRQPPKVIEEVRRAS